MRAAGRGVQRPAVQEGGTGVRDHAAEAVRGGSRVVDGRQRVAAPGQDDHVTGDQGAVDGGTVRDRHEGASGGHPAHALQRLDHGHRPSLDESGLTPRRSSTGDRP